MARDIQVDITDRAIISALNTPGGAVFKWRDRVGYRTTLAAIAKSPVNNPANARHRGGKVGTYKASWGWDRVGSNGHRVQATIYNAADHADFVEFGRRGSAKIQVFSWTAWDGEIRAVGWPWHNGTRARAGRHILRDAVVAVVGRET